MDNHHHANNHYYHFQHHHHQQQQQSDRRLGHADAVTSTSMAGPQLSLPPAPVPPLPPFSFGAMSMEPTSTVAVDPLVFVHEDLVTFALQAEPTQPMQPTQLTQPPPPWTTQDNEHFMAMMFQAPLPQTEAPSIKQEEPQSPLHIHASEDRANGLQTARSLRRSARIAATPRRPPVIDEPMTPPTAHSSASRASRVSVTSGDDDDDDDDDSHDDDDNRGTTSPYAHIVDKKERRRLQVRAASSRRRDKLKAENVFLTTRLQELEEDMRVLRVNFPHLESVLPVPSVRM